MFSFIFCEKRETKHLRRKFYVKKMPTHQIATNQKSASDLETMSLEISKRDAKILAQRQELARLQVETQQSNFMKERTENKFISSDEESQVTRVEAFDWLFDCRLYCVCAAR